jgi:hypothetical protein
MMGFEAHPAVLRDLQPLYTNPSRRELGVNSVLARAKIKGFTVKHRAGYVICRLKI